MTRSQSYINLADDLAQAIARFQIANLNTGGTAEERNRYMQPLCELSVHARNIGVQLRKEEAQNNVIDLTAYRLSMPEGLSW